MTMKRWLCNSLRAGCALAMLVASGLAHGQFIRSSFFMETAQYRIQLNPALVPERGFVNLPAVGNTGAWVQSNVLGIDDAMDIFRHGDNGDYYTTESFNAKLDDRNKATLGVTTDLISAGWWHGKGFMTFNVSVKADGYANTPKEMFTFMQDMRGMHSNDYSNYRCDMRDVEFGINAYVEIGGGYTRVINERLNIGGRVKWLLGMGNLEFKAKNVSVITNLEGVDPDYNWSTGSPLDLRSAKGTAAVLADAQLASSFEGMELVTNDEGYIETLRFRASHSGVAGRGVALDAGISCEVFKGFTLSAAINDLGFIKWDKNCTQFADANTAPLAYDSNDPGDYRRFLGIIGSDEPINLHLLRLTITDQQQSRKTSLASTVTVGARYRTMNGKLSFGALYSCHQVKPNALSELTFGLNYRPANMLDFAISYSPLMCGGQSIGAAMKVGPLFIGSDYIYLGKNIKSCNALVGLSIPLGKSPFLD